MNFSELPTYTQTEQPPKAAVTIAFKLERKRLSAEEIRGKVSELFRALQQSGFFVEQGQLLEQREREFFADYAPQASENREAAVTLCAVLVDLIHPLIGEDDEEEISPQEAILLPLEQHTRELMEALLPAGESVEECLTLYEKSAADWLTYQKVSAQLDAVFQQFLEKCFIQANEEEQKIEEEYYKFREKIVTLITSHELQTKELHNAVDIFAEKVEKIFSDFTRLCVTGQKIGERLENQQRNFSVIQQQLQDVLKKIK